MKNDEALNVMTPTSLRRAGLEDIPAICELGREVNRIHHEAWPSIFSAQPSDDEGHWRSVVLSEMTATFVAQREVSVVGFAVVQLVDEGGTFLCTRRHAKILSVCVSAASRGQGIGRQLMTAAESWAGANGAIDLSLSVWKFNQSAVQLYEQLGYEVRALSLGKALSGSSAPA